MTRYEEKRFVVTGAASGIGEAAAKLLKQRGAAVIAYDRHEPAPGVADEFIQFDQGDFESVEAAAKRAPAMIDGVLNIAGAPPSSNLTPAKLLATNFFGLRRFTECLRERLAHGASIVNMSSQAGFRWRENIEIAKEFFAKTALRDVEKLVRRYKITIDGLGDNAAYPLSKQLLNLWTVASYTENQKQGIRMNAATAAAVDTPILNDFLDSFGEDSAARIRAIGTATPEMIALSLAFLASDDSAWIKSAIIPIDGGATALATIKSLGLDSDQSGTVQSGATKKKRGLRLF